MPDMAFGRAQIPENPLAVMLRQRIPIEIQIQIVLLGPKTHNCDIFVTTRCAKCTSHTVASHSERIATCYQRLQRSPEFLTAQLHRPCRHKIGASQKSSDCYERQGNGAVYP